MQRRHVLFSILVLIVSLALTACGGSSPTSPSGAQGVTLHGVALGSGATGTFHGRAGSLANSGGSKITVTVQENTTITATISGSGTFELEGLPAGTFTLVFSSNGVTIGTVTITSVPTGADVNVVVQINTTVVILVKVEVNGTDETDNEKNDAKTCLIDGGKVGSGIELEGHVSSVSGTTFVMAVNGERSGGPVTVDASGASFKCNGDTGKSDNGKGNGTCDATSLTVGVQVHVSGTLTSCSLSAAQVTASQVMLQH